MPEKPISLRVPGDRLERINARAKAAGKTRNQYILDRADPEGATARATNPGDMVKPSTACQHPRDQLQRFGWGTLCGVCGIRLR